MRQIGTFSITFCKLNACWNFPVTKTGGLSGFLDTARAGFSLAILLTAHGLLEAIKLCTF